MEIMLLYGWLWAAPPPERYDFPYKGKLEVLRVGEAEANRICRAKEVSRTGRVGGCALYYSQTKCIIVLNVESTMSQASILRHEMGHCNGWPFHHPR